MGSPPICLTLQGYTILGRRRGFLTPRWRLVWRVTFRKPREKEVRTRMRGECSRSKLEGRVAVTPDIDDKLFAFFAKFT